MTLYDNREFADGTLDTIRTVCRILGCKVRVGEALRNGAYVTVLRATATDASMGDRLRDIRTLYNGFLVDTGECCKAAFIFSPSESERDREEESPGWQYSKP